MKTRDSSVRMKRFEVAERTRKVADLEMMARDFEAMVTDLDRQITTEEERTGIRDRSHFAYSTFAKAAIQRRENLLASVAGARAQIDDARRSLEEAQDDLRRLETEDLRETSTLDRGRHKGERTSASAS
jgi:multidrug resistance efflux pump